MFTRFFFVVLHVVVHFHHCITLHCVNVPKLTSLFFCQCLDCFSFVLSWIKACATMSILVCVFQLIHARISIGYMPRNGITGFWGGQYLLFRTMPSFSFFSLLGYFQFLNSSLPTQGLFRKPFPLLEILFPLAIYKACPLYSLDVGLNVTSAERPSLTTLWKASFPLDSRS